MIDKQQRLDDLLESLAKERGVLGVALVSRDGLPVRTRGKVELARETFSAMTATVMGATEIALGELNGGPVRHLVAVTDRVKLVVVGATADILLVAALQPDVQQERLLPGLESTAKNVATVVAGG